MGHGKGKETGEDAEKRELVRKKISTIKIRNRVEEIWRRRVEDTEKRDNLKGPTINCFEFLINLHARFKILQTDLTCSVL